MKFFVVTYIHRDPAGWKKQLDSHVEYLKDLLSRGTLRASGPLFGLAAAPSPARAGMLIFTGTDKEAILEVLRADPFMVHNLVDEMTIAEWDPVVGTYAKESSGNLHG